MDNQKILDKIKNGLIVSCQALKDEPLHSSFIMSKMAKAAKMGGAVGIRANGKDDIISIKNEVNLPLIGIVKKTYVGSDVYITPTIKEVDELVSCGVEIIALDATKQLRPNNKSLEMFFKEIKEKYPNQLLMADCSTYEEMVFADILGFDIISSTLVGYTKHSKNFKINANDFELISKAISNIKKPFIAEGNIDTPEKLKRVLELGCFASVVGSIITRPQIITKKFVDAISK